MRQAKCNHKLKEIKILINWIAIIKAILLVSIFYLFIGTISTTGFMLSMLERIETPEELQQFLQKNKNLAVFLGDIGLFLSFWISAYFFKENRLLHMSIIALVFSSQNLLSILIYDDSVKNALMNSAIVFALMLAAYGTTVLFQKLKR